MGGLHSGSNIHTDPLGTSAWNTLLLGRKLWALFPPGTCEASLKTAETMGRKAGGNNKQMGALLATEGGVAVKRPLDFCASGWFAHMLPGLPAEVAAEKILFIQEQGETVFVPAGWFHAVLNLSTAVCVTQNYASPHDYSKVSRALYSTGGSEGDSEGADEWRVKVARSGVWEEALTHNHLHAALDFCVHCGRKSHGNVSELLDNRPVCAGCEGSEKYGAEYALMSAAAVLEEFGLDLLGGELAEDEVPPSVEKTGDRDSYFLRSHVLQMVAEQEEHLQAGEANR